MSEKFVPIITEKFGELNGRDCIYLDTVTFDEMDNLTFTGSLNTSLIGVGKTSTVKFLPYQLTFKRVIHYSATELDTYCRLKGDDFSQSSFDEVLNSQFLANFPIREDYEKSDFRHFLIFTYDYVFDILAKDFVFE